jgi:crotonobetainyl-CoA:carnitine CoA-transferase CaiB-like acyl-CoA transferase
MNKQHYPDIFNAFPNIDIANTVNALEISQQEALLSYFGVSEIASESLAIAGVMLSRLLDKNLNAQISVDGRLASLWFKRTIRPIQWSLPPIWGDITGDYLTSDGWMRIHANANKHRAAAITVIEKNTNTTISPNNIAETIATCKKEQLTEDIINAGGCAAVMYSAAEWAEHPQGIAVAQEPLIHWNARRQSPQQCHQQDAEPYTNNVLRPLQNIKVLDLTRILAGPIATRFLAAYGADVLRIDPPSWDEPSNAPEVTLGKHCASLDLNQEQDRQILRQKIKEADVLVHGYRPGALDKLGFDQQTLQSLNPNLIDVSLNAYGWTGPWCERRGFDSLLQMSSGIAAYAMQSSQNRLNKPLPLPAQALDHSTGYLMAAAVLYAVEQRQNKGMIYSARLSLARTAHMLLSQHSSAHKRTILQETPSDINPQLEHTVWGVAQRIYFPLNIHTTAGEIRAQWDKPATPLHTHQPQWQRPTQ